jgi:hypothetical protein
MHEAGRDFIDDTHTQLLGLEWRFHIDPGRVRRQSQQVGVVMAWAQGGGKQHAAARRCQPRADEFGGHYIAQAQGRAAALGAERALADIEDEVLVEQLRNLGKLQRFKIEGLQLPASASGWSLK